MALKARPNASSGAARGEWPAQSTGEGSGSEEILCRWNHAEAMHPGGRFRGFPPDLDVEAALDVALNAP